MKRYKLLLFTIALTILIGSVKGAYPTPLIKEYHFGVIAGDEFHYELSILNVAEADLVTYTYYNDTELILTVLQDAPVIPVNESLAGYFMLEERREDPISSIVSNKEIELNTKYQMELMLYPTGFLLNNGSIVSYPEYHRDMYPLRAIEIGGGTYNVTIQSGDGWAVVDIFTGVVQYLYLEKRTTENTFELWYELIYTAFNDHLPTVINHERTATVTNLSTITEEISVLSGGDRILVASPVAISIPATIYLLNKRKEFA